MSKSLRFSSAFAVRVVRYIGAIGLFCTTELDGRGLRVAYAQRVAIDSVPMLVMPTGRQREFGDVVGAVRLSNGTLVVADGGYRVVRFFDQRGKEIASQGRQGAGPGEYRHLAWIGRCAPDSVFAFDPNLARMTVLDSKGKVARTFRVAAGKDRPPYKVQCSETGEIVVVGWPQFKKEIPIGPYQVTQPIVRIDRSGGVLHTIGEFSGDERYRFERGDGPRIFGKTLAVALAQGRMYVGEGDRYAIRMLGMKGEMLGTLEVKRNPRPITQTDIDQYREASLAKVRDPDHRAAQRRGFGKYVFPDVFPFYAGLTVDPRGVIWIKNYPAPADLRETWTILSSDSSFHDVVMPRGFELLHTDTELVVGKATSATGTPEIRLYRAHRQADPSRSVVSPRR